jgi:hypothetical protein
MPVAATRAKSISYVYLKMVIRDREVGGSNPLAPTIYFQVLTAIGIGGLFFGRDRFVVGIVRWGRSRTLLIRSDLQKTARKREARESNHYR